VIDDGPGVPAEKVDRLFTRFVHEGDEALTVGSVGLGLAVVKALADGMDGEVRYRRADGWTSFEVTLPLAPAESDAPAPSAAPPATLQVAASSEASDSSVSGYRLGSYASSAHAHEH
jgi:two-component system OmpR family sensor kinase